MHGQKGVHRPVEDHERRQWQNPEAILADIGLKLGFTFVDIGCGGGFFALPAARIVGKRGKVYGLDTDAESIASLREQAARESLKKPVPHHRDGRRIGHVRAVRRYCFLRDGTSRFSRTAQSLGKRKDDGQAYWQIGQSRLEERANGVRPSPENKI